MNGEPVQTARTKLGTIQLSLYESEIENVQQDKSFPSAFCTRRMIKLKR